MKKYKFEIIFSTALIAISIMLYSLQYYIENNGRLIFDSILSQLAFLPIYVLLITLAVEKFINFQSKQALLKKLNVVIGAFFNELGRELLLIFSDMDDNFYTVKDLFLASPLKGVTLKDVIICSKSYNCNVNSKNPKLIMLKGLLLSKQAFLLNMMENPNLMEHESFTELLLSVFHLYEELYRRNNIEKLSEADYSHLSTDIERAYKLLINQWLNYMKHLKENYPYLYSLEVRLNPFNPNATAEISDLRK